MTLLVGVFSIPGCRRPHRFAYPGIVLRWCVYQVGKCSVGIPANVDNCRVDRANTCAGFLSRSVSNGLFQTCDDFLSKLGHGLNDRLDTLAIDDIKHRKCRAGGLLSPAF